MLKFLLTCVSFQSSFFVAIYLFHLVFHLYMLRCHMHIDVLMLAQFNIYFHILLAYLVILTLWKLFCTVKCQLIRTSFVYFTFIFYLQAYVMGMIEDFLLYK